MQAENGEPSDTGFLVSLLRLSERAGGGSSLTPTPPQRVRTGYAGSRRVHEPPGRACNSLPRAVTGSNRPETGCNRLQQGRMDQAPGPAELT